VEPRANGPTTIVFTLNGDIADGTIDSNEFTIVNATFGSASISGDQLTLNLTDVVDQSVVGVTLNGINDTNGNPVTGDTDAEIRALVGDAKQDRSVGLPDAQGVKMHLGVALDQTSENFLFDLDLNGTIARRDIRVIRANKAHTVP
jgi:hypothetical protein